MDNNTFVHVSYSNSSSQGPCSEFIYKHGLIKLENDGRLKCFKRSEEDIKKFGLKITRYGDFKLCSTKEFNNKNTVEDVLENLLVSETPGVSLERAEKSLLMVIAAIQSHKNRECVSFNQVKDSGLRIS